MEELPSWAPLRLKLWHIERQQRQSRELTQHKVWEAVGQKKPDDEIKRLWEFQHVDDKMYEEEIESLMSQALLRRAHRMFLPIPDKWEKGRTGQRYLSREAMTSLREAVAHERRLRREGILGWLAPLTGVIGALTGLVSVLSR